MKRALHRILLLVFISSGHSTLSAQVIGKFYSLVTFGGVPIVNSGTINVFDPLTDKDTAVIPFTIANGQLPYGNLIQAKNGLLYGMASEGGTDHNMGQGDLFTYDVTTGQENVIYSFSENHNAADGFQPYGSLLIDTNGLMYGTCYLGGRYDSGTIFSFDPVHDTEIVLCSMANSTIGKLPTGNLILGSDGLLYGTATDGYGNNGTIFSFDITRDTAKLLFTFTGMNGDYPRGSLLKVNDSMMYGMTLYGGFYNRGTLYSFNYKSNIETLLISFNGTNGAYPGESLMQASDGNLYGTTYYGGTLSLGSFFRYNIDSNTITVLHNFNDTDGQYPWDDLVQASNGLLYGNTNLGGAHDSGVIFSYNIDSNIERTLYSYTLRTGALPYGDYLEVMTADASVTNNICPNDVGGALTINARGGKPPFTYLWSTGATTSSISNLASGVYTYTVTDSTGMTLTYSDTVKPLPIKVSFDATYPCYGGNTGSAKAIVYGGTGPFTYSWNNGSTIDSIFNLDAGNYSVLITDANGCPAALDTIVITQAGVLTITGFNTTESTYPNFNNGSIKVQVSGGIPPGDSVYYLYLWSNGGSTADSISGLDSGKYAICVTSPYGCGSICDSNIDITSIEEFHTPGNIISVYPVPSTGSITIGLKGFGFKEIEITDALGTEVYQQYLNSRVNTSTLNIDLNGLAEGVYILHVNSRQGVLTRKIILQK